MDFGMQFFYRDKRFIEINRNFRHNLPGFKPLYCVECRLRCQCFMARAHSYAFRNELDPGNNKRNASIELDSTATSDPNHESSSYTILAQSSLESINNSKSAEILATMAQSSL
jgi:hypothetical protein